MYKFCWFNRLFLLGSLLLCIGALGREAKAGSLSCDPPVVQIEVLSQPAQVSNTASTRSLTTHTNAAHPTVGLYRSHQRFYIRTKQRQYSNESGICVTHLYVTYAINHVIDISSEYAPGTCQYEETLKHERTHEMLHLLKAADAGTYLKQQLSKNVLWFGGDNPEKDIKEWLRNTLEYSGKVYETYIKPAQDAFDSPEEYARYGRACPRNN